MFVPDSWHLICKILGRTEGLRIGLTTNGEWFKAEALVEQYFQSASSGCRKAVCKTINLWDRMLPPDNKVRIDSATPSCCLLQEQLLASYGEGKTHLHSPIQDTPRVLYSDSITMTPYKHIGE